MQNMNEVNKAASISFNVAKVSELNEKYDLMYSVLSQPPSNASADMNNATSSSSKRKLKPQHKSPYNVSIKKKSTASGKKRSIESDPKELSTNVPNTNQSDTRYKMQLSHGQGNENILRAQIINAKNERSFRLPNNSNIIEESKRSEDNSIKMNTSIYNKETLGDLKAGEVPRLYLGSSNLTQESLETEQNQIINILRKKNKEQDVLIDEYKEREVEYKDKIYELEKELREAKHKFELSKMEHDREVELLNKKLEEKNELLDRQLEDFVMNKLDLDEYNLTSDDFRDSHESSKNINKESRNSKLIRRSSKKTNVTRVHPLVPKLDLQKIYEWRDKTNNDNVIMIRISESRITGEDQLRDEINDEEGIQKGNKKYFPRGSNVTTSSDRNNELFERKQMIISALNQAYTDEDEDASMTPKGEEYDTEA